MKLLLLATALAAVPVAAPAPATSAEVLARSAPGDWHPLDPANTLYVELPTGRVVIELAPAFAPQHVENVRALVAERYFDGLSILRSQDNYVVQWGDPDGDTPAKAKPLGKAKRKLPAEFSRTLAGLAFVPLADGDVYAPKVGWSGDFPTAEDPEAGQAWLTHCYGTVGAGRDNPPDSSNGAELYVVIGQSPRHLDRNITTVGRVVWGMELLSALPRGPPPMGFYSKPEQRVPLTTVRFASNLPPEQRTSLEVLRTDSPTFARWVETRRNRREPWYVHPAGHVELCNLPIPVRRANPPPHP